MSTTRRGGLGLALAAVLAPAAAPAQSQSLVVFAAASLKNALGDVAAAWAKDAGKPAPRLSYAASSALARQIEQGAPAELFFSADADWMDHVADKNLIKADTRVDLLGNRIVLVAPRDSSAAVDLSGGGLARALGGGRLAMANVDGVPAGRYGKAALEALGVWNAVKPQVAQAENVRAALLLVARGEAPLGIVYATDAAVEPKVRVVASFPDGSHPAIVYPVAITRDSTRPDARSFLDYLQSAAARSIFEKHGFRVLVRTGSLT